MGVDTQSTPIHVPNLVVQVIPRHTVTYIR